MEAPESESKPPRAAAVLRRTALTMYDSLWGCAGVSLMFWVGPYVVLVAALGGGRGGGVGWLVLGVIGLTAWSFSAAVLLAYARAVVAREYEGFAGVLRRAWSAWRRVAAWGAANALVVGVGVVDLSFYLQARSLWVAVLGALWLYLFLFWIALQIYVGPALARGKGLLRAVREGALLVMDNIVFTIAVAGVLAGVGALLAAPFLLLVYGVPWLAAGAAAVALFGAPSAGAVLSVEAYEALLAYYQNGREPSGGE